MRMGWENKRCATWNTIVDLLNGNVRESENICGLGKVIFIFILLFVILWFLWKMGYPLEDHLQERFEEVAGDMIKEIQGMIKSKSYLNIFRDNDVDMSFSFTKTVVLHLFCQDLVEKEYWDLDFEIPVIVFSTFPYHK